MNNQTLSSGALVLSLLMSQSSLGVRWEDFVQEQKTKPLVYEAELENYANVSAVQLTLSSERISHITEVDNLLFSAMKNLAEKLLKESKDVDPNIVKLVNKNFKNLLA